MFSTFLLNAEVPTVTSVLALVTSFVTWVITQIGSFVNLVVSNPMLFIPFAIFVAGAAIAFFIRLLKSV